MALRFVFLREETKMTSEVEGFIVLFIFNLTGQEVTAEQDLFELGVVDSLAFNELLLQLSRSFQLNLTLTQSMIGQASGALED